jgi:hypothetical protein
MKNIGENPQDKSRGKAHKPFCLKNAICCLTNSYRIIVWKLFRCPERFAEKRRVTGISHVEGTAVDYEVVKGFHLGVPEPSRGFGQLLSHAFEKIKNLIGADVL